MQTPNAEAVAYLEQDLKERQIADRTVALVREDKSADPPPALLLDYLKAVDFLAVAELLGLVDTNEYRIVQTPEALARKYQNVAEFDGSVSQDGPGLGRYIGEFYAKARQYVIEDA